MRKKGLFKTNAFLVVILSGLLVLLPAAVGAQSSTAVFRANNDNVFVTPGVTIQFMALWNDELGECGESDVQMVLLDTEGPFHGRAQLNAASKVIRYAPDVTDGVPFTGRDSLTYRITCKGQVSEARIYFHISNMPDNMEMEACAITLPATSWDIKQVAVSDEFVQIYAQPFVGDIDNDSILEIITLNSYATRLSNEILIFDPDLKLKKQIPTPVIESYGACPLLIADVDGDGFGEIIIATGKEDGYYLYCYRYDGTLMWTSYPYSYFKTTPPATPNGNSAALIIGDINNDGYAEIIAGDRIFDARDGWLLADLPEDAPRGGMHSSGCYIYMPVMADFDNDGRLEIACGSMVYKATITERSPSAYQEQKNIVTIVADISTDLPEERMDGYTSVADIDGDGFLDVVVVNGSRMNATNSYNSATLMYAWSPHKKQLLASVSPTGNSRLGSRAFIGDVRGDGNPTICFTYSTGQSTEPRGGMVGYQYNKATGLFEKLFQKDTSDSSGGTTMSMFDFDLDGEVELIYRDETHLRILDKNGQDRIKIDCLSGTHTEYSVIVDVDKDGHADIIVSGALIEEGGSAGIRLMRFSHPANTWAACRYVNNQHAYNPVYINQDLTVPQYPLNPATEFVSKDGTRRTKPFNHFLQQVTDLNDEGETLFEGPDIYFDKNYRTSLLWDATADRIDVSIAVNNMGNTTYANDLQVSTYLLDGSQDPIGEYLIHQQTFPSVSIKEGIVELFSYEIPGIAAKLAAVPHYTAWEVRLNWDDATQSFPMHQQECRYYNNVSSNISVSYGEHVMCESDPMDPETCEVVKIYPQGVYDYYWYDTPTPASTAEAIWKGDEMVVCKDNSVRQQYFIQVWDKGSSQVLTSKLDTVDVYLFPDTLVWTGMAQDQDWHNPENWHNPRQQLYPRSNVPRHCTNVLIPDIVDNFPDLSPSKTSYDYYPASECNHISFEHGGQLAHPDSLHYTAAYVNLALLSNRWYMLSAPLRHFYPGDFYVHDPNPCDDDVFAYTRLFGATNPHSGHYVAADWTGTFHNPDVAMAPGLGFSLWVDDKQPDVTVHDSIFFSFPKKDPYYNVYGTNCRFNFRVPIERTQEHRFIYEANRNPASGEITLEAKATAPGEMLILGNPFMSVLDFQEFYSHNAALIEPYYKVLDATDGNFISYDLQTGASTGSNLTAGIAPMQSVLVESRGVFSSLSAFSSMTTTAPQVELKSAGRYLPPNLLPITLSKEGQANKTILAYHAAGMQKGQYSGIPKVFMEDATLPVSVFLVDNKGDYKDICHVDKLDDGPFYLGIRTSQKGSIRLDVGATNRFAPGYEIYLTDLAPDKPRQVNLRVYPYYEFEKQDGELFLTDRFLLSFVPVVTHNQPLRSPEPSTGIEAYCRDGSLQVISVDGMPLKEVALFDLQGRLVKALPAPNAFRAEIPLQQEGMYILRAKTQQSERTIKVYVR
ncbi:MAG: T9SS type A sorting domain-containing protein [Candidatus Azobacteroides sp.]|nr:T9SS type A sorting domain-containing protein [Candidatus Azobacteroides sp.]